MVASVSTSPGNRRNTRACGVCVLDTTARAVSERGTLGAGGRIRYIQDEMLYSGLKTG